MNQLKEKWTTRLADTDTTLQPVDSMAEAGRKVLAENFKQMLSHEAGARTGEDIEDVHQMRVATRRMRSAFRLFGRYYKPKSIKPFTGMLKKVAAALGRVRDLDVMIDDLTTYQATLDETARQPIQSVIAKLDKRRISAREDLNDLLDSSKYASFLKDFTRFLTSPGKGTVSMDSNGVQPYQVRHITPILIHEKLANVHAYDEIVQDHAVEPETLHALRIEFKRLRYTVTFFKGVLGASIEDFIMELKAMQDYLGRFNDLVVASERLLAVRKLSTEERAALQVYVDGLQAELSTKHTDFTEIWESFNRRTVRRKLSDALLVLH